MLIYILRRVLAGAVLLWISITIIFLMLQLIPGDPAYQILAGDGSDPSPEAVANLREQLGLDRPGPERYISYLVGVVSFDFGNSFVFSTPVESLLGPRLAVTLELALFALIVGTFLGTFIGSLAARAKGIVDTVLSALLSIGISIPVYVVGALLILVFALKLGWFPAGSFEPITGDVAEHFRRIVLPVLALSIPVSSVVGRMARSSMLENIQQDWVRTARSWGLSPNTVFNRHVLRNSMIPVTSVAGLEAGALIGSTVVVERIFNLPGIGSLLIDSVNDRDYPVVQAVVIVVCISFVVLSIAVDVIYGILDPRVRRRAA
ncbi:ABC transporter permease [Brevibacterium sp. SMBL_HHYL_HB1]|uniref:ABC transporter permease n=1 Tax=Brevibacterium sp. SMBL_HHYL_HB1 TaxID=2777556 RepID=UPI001BA52285|nr:ABC transporter permease [Brevibacterium sp. SMBL_HHYL_HB1]QUL80668.1 ABC transporter permease [Brevibacterium sp. SMBL_HHYL_HB1]